MVRGGQEPTHRAWSDTTRIGDGSRAQPLGRVPGGEAQIHARTNMGIERETELQASQDPWEPLVYQEEKEPTPSWSRAGSVCNWDETERATQEEAPRWGKP